MNETTFEFHGRQCSCIHDVETAKARLRQAAQASVIAIDTETRGLYGPLVAISFCHSNEPNHGFVMFAKDIPVAAIKEELQAAADVEGAYANYSYDAAILLREGIRTNPKTDVIVTSWIIDSDSLTHNLKDLTARWIGVQMITLDELFGSKAIAKAMNYDFSSLPITRDVIVYACSDALFTLALHFDFESKITPKTKFIYDMENRLLPVIFRMEQRGVMVETKRLDELAVKFQEEVDKEREELYKLAGHKVEINSTRELAHLFFNEFNLPVQDVTKTGQPSCSAKALAPIANVPIVAAVLKLKSNIKLLKDFILKLPTFVGDDSRIHASFKQIGTKSGRICCTNPNLMQIPKKGGSTIRSAFVPTPDHYFYDIDYGQIEYRVFASMAGDEKLKKAFIDKVDFHASTASDVFHKPIEEVTSDERKKGKICNFAILYGASGYGLSHQINCTPEEGDELINSYFASHPKVTQFIRQSQAFCSTNKMVYTYFGRPRHLPMISNPAFAKGVLRQCVNTQIQGTAADILKLALLRVDKVCREKYAGKAFLLLTIHDELLFEVHNSVPLEEFSKDIKEAMQIKVDGWVDLIADPSYGPDWGNLTEMEDGDTANKSAHEEEEELALVDENGDLT